MSHLVLLKHPLPFVIGLTPLAWIEVEHASEWVWYRLPARRVFYQGHSTWVWVLKGWHRQDGYGNVKQSCLYSFFLDGHGKIIPGGNAGIGPMKGSKYFFLQSGPYGMDQAICPGGQSDLFIDDIKAWFFFHEVEHGFYKIISMAGIEPGCSDDQCFFIQSLADGLFPIESRPPEDA